jgi:hypothetical protein
MLKKTTRKIRLTERNGRVEYPKYCIAAYCIAIALYVLTNFVSAAPVQRNQLS